MNKEVEVEHVGGDFVRKTISCYISKLELVEGSPRASDELIIKKLKEEAGLESHYNKPFVSSLAEYNPDDEIYRISLTWFEFENRSQVRMATTLNENFQQNSHDIPEEMEPPC